MRPETDECLDKVSALTGKPLGRELTYNLGELDRTIESTNTNIAYLKETIKQKELYLSKLKQIRKTVTPEMEAAIAALQSVRLI